MAVRIEKKETSSKETTRTNEIIAVALLALALFVFLSLVSYNQNDYVPFLNPTSKESKNLIGMVGATIAALLFQAIGLTVYILPAALVLVAWRIFRSTGLSLPISRIIGFLLLIISVSSFIALFSPIPFDNKYYGLVDRLLDSYGGFLGYIFAGVSVMLIGEIGAGILFIALFVLALIFSTNISFASLSDSLEMAKENLLIRLEMQRNRRREAREQQSVEKEKKEQEKPERAEKSKLPEPTISIGETTAANQKGNFETVGGRVSNVFKKLAKQHESPETLAEDVNEIKSPVIEEVEAAPTINGSENFKEPESDKEQVKTPIVHDLVFGDEKIPITPIRETGELDEEILEEAETIAQKEPEPPSKPQNFDNYALPSTEFLVPAQPRIEQKDEELLSIAQELTGKTKEFNVTGRVVHICQGPVVTTYEFKPDPGVKYSRVTGLADDLCLALKAESIRIERIPGKAFVGIEVPNQHRETIQLREVIESKKFRESNSLLTVALGKTIDGLNYVADLAKMPHLLIAGATGAGKSVGVNTLVVSILYKAKPDEVKFIMVDPKRLELGVYEDIPHLATPIIKDPKRAAIALKWAVSEMEKRYKDLAGWGVRNIDGFNTEVERRNANEQFDDNGEPHKKLPYIVIIIDELADLMMVSGKEVEESITRLAQMARAVGIHLVLATQRPSVDVITGLIKANFPSRISFRVSSKVDSRTIIDSNGAESLLGKGDMLFLPPATSQLVRVHGAFVDEKEIYKIVEHIKAQGRPEYDTTITKTEDELDDSGELPGRKDELFWDALRTVVMAKKASTSLLQRHLRIGYGRAAAILDAMVKEGYIGDMDGSSRARPILQKAYDDLQDIEEQESV